MSNHGNSLGNNNLHHLYEVFDNKEAETFKYGISDDPIEGDGLSKRVRYQVNLFNRVVGTLRFIGKVLIKNIPGRQKALDLENEHIDKFENEKGKRPRGNPR